MGKGSNLHLWGTAPKRCFAHVMARDSDTVLTAKENILTDFFAMVLDLLVPF